MNSNDIIHMAREAGIDAHIKVGAAELERFAALVAAAAPKQTEADHLKLHAIEELCQLGYTVKDGELFPPDHLHKLIEAAGHPLAVSTQDEAVRQPAALKDVPEAMNAVIDAMQADPDYAWSWHCNVAMAFVDAGGDPYTANQGAARFMRLLANVDPAHELPPQQAEAVPQDVERDAKAYHWLATALTSPEPYSVLETAFGHMKQDQKPTKAEFDAAVYAAIAAAPQPKEQSNAVCRSDGKCQYAIDHDAEKLGHCPTGKCVMPRQAETALQPKGGV